MEGNENITEKTDKKKTAQFVKTAMEKLNGAVNEKTITRIMQNCGYNCAKKNHRVIERAVARRKKYGNIEKFLEAEQQKPTKGTKLTREGNTHYISFTRRRLSLDRWGATAGCSRNFRKRTRCQSRIATVHGA
jgi:predicted transcriptional regulator